MLTVAQQLTAKLEPTDHLQRRGVASDQGTESHADSTASRQVTLEIDRPRWVENWRSPPAEGVIPEPVGRGRGSSDQ